MPERLQRISCLICKVEHWTCKNDCLFHTYLLVCIRCSFAIFVVHDQTFIFLTEAQVSLPYLQINRNRLVIRLLKKKLMLGEKDEGVVGPQVKKVIFLPLLRLTQSVLSPDEYNLTLSRRSLLSANWIRKKELRKIFLVDPIMTRVGRNHMLAPVVQLLSFGA